MKTRALRAPLELIAATAFLLAGLADALSTAAGLHRGAHEANPIAAGLFDHLGIVPVLALRVVLPALAAWALVRVVKREPVLQRVAACAVLVVAALWCALAIRNGFV